MVFGLEFIVGLLLYGDLKIKVDWDGWTGAKTKVGRVGRVGCGICDDC